MPWFKNGLRQDRRYHPQRWRKIAAKSRLMTRDRCCLCSSRATEVHHAYYGLDCFPVALGLLVSLAIATWLLGIQVWTVGAGILCALLWNVRLPIPGHEIPGWQVFPLCSYHHSNSKGCAHNLGNYQVFPNKWRNKNTSKFLWRLRFGYGLKIWF